MHCSGHYGLIKFSNTNWNLALPWQPPTILFQPLSAHFSAPPPGRHWMLHQKSTTFTCLGSLSSHTCPLFFLPSLCFAGVKGPAGCVVALSSSSPAPTRRSPLFCFCWLFDWNKCFSNLSWNVSFYEHFFISLALLLGYSSFRFVAYLSLHFPSTFSLHIFPQARRIRGGCRDGDRDRDVNTHTHICCRPSSIVCCLSKIAALQKI